MDGTSWPQGFQETKLMKSMEGMSYTSPNPPTTTMNPTNATRPTMLEKKARPQEQLNCPRCNSTNTKFCYYNNYSLTQPRYFCKTCRRYWTEGGSLRNVPVGGGSRKNKRSSSSHVLKTSSSSSPSPSLSNRLPDLNPPSLSQFSSQNPTNSNKAHLDHGGQELNLGFPPIHESQALELLRTGIASRGLNSFMPTPMSDSNTLYPSSGFHDLQEFKQPILGFDVHDHGRSMFGSSIQEDGSGGSSTNIGPSGRVLFPFGDQLKQISSSNEVENNTKGKGSNTSTNTSSGYNWNGMLGGGGSW